MGRRVHRVDEGERPPCAGSSDHGGHVGDRPEGVGGRADRDDAGPVGQQAVERVQIELAIAHAERHLADHQPQIAGEVLPGSDVGLMVEACDHDFVARSSALSRWPATGDR